MRHLLLLTVAIAASGFAHTSWACVEPDTPTLRESLDSATSVTIVRLTSLDLVNTSQNSRDLTGKLQTVRVLKGSPQFRLLRHQAVSCGGLNLQVGHYYMVATRQSGNVLHLERGDRSIVDISSDYASTIPVKSKSRLWQTQFADYLAGKPLPKSFNPLPIMYPVYAFPPAPEAQW
jgi:hypothetical protein